ncbi:hypothetical protein CLAC_02265 [Corynebacterium lactis RW2-5]|uniref:Uncharacterized protein n=2 Tax=Corynebacterium lactis TaxID=1231000 RepID=A0A0K2H2Z7_9CORY|nr:hypothetical protein CLAC_02265 [Corynebacterium lactis RW2-5]
MNTFENSGKHRQKYDAITRDYYASASKIKENYEAQIDRALEELRRLKERRQAGQKAGEACAKTAEQEVAGRKTVPKNIFAGRGRKRKAPRSTVKSIVRGA